jgi:aquaglyceroporin related protein
MAAAAVVYGNYKSAFDAYEGGPGIRTVVGENATAGVFCTYPAEFMTRTGMFFSEFVASTILQFVIFAMADSANIGAGPLMPLGLFFLIFGIGACFGWETGYAINLARDFGPRLVSYMIGYGSEVWSAGGYYFWVSFKLSILLLNSGLTDVTRFPWWLPSLAVLSVASSMMYSSTQDLVPSTHLVWVSDAS